MKRNWKEWGEQEFIPDSTTSESDAQPSAQDADSANPSDGFRADSGDEDGTLEVEGAASGLDDDRIESEAEARRNAIMRHLRAATVSRTYQQHKDDPALEPVFTAILAIDAAYVDEGLHVINEATGISMGDLYRWRYHLVRDEGWRPSKDHYGQQTRAMTELEEATLVQLLHDYVIATGIPCTEKMMCVIAREFWRVRVLDRRGAAGATKRNHGLPREPPLGGRDPGEKRTHSATWKFEAARRH
jgi:hypothetical protein